MFSVSRHLGAATNIKVFKLEISIFSIKYPPWSNVDNAVPDRRVEGSGKTEAVDR